MSSTVSITPIGAPVTAVDEQIIVVPPQGLTVSNRARKLLFFFEADCFHRIEKLDDSRVQLSAGDVLVLPHLCQQRYETGDGQTTRVHALRIVLDPAKIAARALGSEAAAPQQSADETAIWLGARLDNFAHIRGGMNAEVRETIARLRRETEATGAHATGYALRAGAACLDLMVLVARQLQSETPLATQRGSARSFRVEEAREFIAKHFDSALSLSQIAAHGDVSPEHLARLWKSETGTTIFEAVRRARLERAKSLLIASDLNISQIAEACGFSSLALFSRNFKSATGVSPARYRGQLEFRG